MSVFFRFVIMGPPGAGKGTISSRIVKNFNLAYVASGDALRAQIMIGSEEGKIAKKYIAQGQLVPNDLVTKLILKQLGTFSESNWLLDGYPRTVQQAEDLSASYMVTSAINLDVPDEVIVSRLKGRWLHLASGRIYNTEFNPSKVPGVDDVTGEALVQRDDDKPEIVKARLLAYRKANSLILDYYRKKKVLQEFSGKETNQIWPHVKLYLEGMLGKQK